MLAARNFIVSAAATAVYVALDAAQRVTREMGRVQMAQAVMCAVAGVAAAQDGKLVILVYLEFIACIVHIMQATMIAELRRVGDCRNCLKRADECQCQLLKDPVPPGALSDASVVVQRSWRRTMRFQSRCDSL